jgi:hypothetical protein
LVIFFAKLLLDEIVREEKLRNDFFSSQISFDSELAGHAKNAVDGAADLAGYAEGDSVEFFVFVFTPVKENYCFDGEIVVCFESDFYIILTFQYRFRGEGQYFKFFAQLLSEVFGDSRHAFKVDILIVVDFLDNLFYSKRLELVLFGEVLEIIWVEN